MSTQTDTLKPCPRCGELNSDNWPLASGPNGCQCCWEQECAESWWEQMDALNEVGLLEVADG